MSSTPRAVGTLIVVILKARNLINKRHIGKQTPYCAVTFNHETRRTKAIKRGGQHPEWDEEVRFTLYESDEDERAREANGGDSPPPPPPKDDKEPKSIKGGKDLKISCYADDPREPDLIGETTVDLTEALTKGETDEWFTLMHKDKPYCGEVYLELTFWSNAPVPKKKAGPKSAANKQYGGPGSFVPIAEDAPYDGAATARTVQSRIASTSVLQDGSRRDSLPSSLRPSGSLAQLDLYVPPYERRRTSHMSNGSTVDQMTNEFSELGVNGYRGRTESYPPLRNGYPARTGSTGSLSAAESFTHGYEQSTYSDGSSSFYDRPVTPTVYPGDYSAPANYQSHFEATPPPSGYPGYPSPPHSVGSRYSIHSSSSGFMPLSTPSGFMPLQSHPSESPGFGDPSRLPNYAPPPAPTPGPSGFTPAPSGFMPSTSLSSSISFHSQPQSSFPYHLYNQPPSGSPAPLQYAPPQPPVSTPPQQYPLPQPPMSVPPGPPHSAPPQQYQGYALPAPSPSHDYPTISPATSGLVINGGSRPLPQQPPQPQGYPQPPRRQSSLPVPPPPPPSVGQQSAVVAFPSSIPPPPPQHSHSQDSILQPYTSNMQQYNHKSIPPPPPPPPPSHLMANTSTGTTSSGRPPLPQPPVSYSSGGPQPIYQPLPPPPPSNIGHNQPPPPPPLQQPNGGPAPYPGPPPRPPQMNGHSHWYPPPGPQESYPSHWPGVVEQ